jgi:hypothetical protein
MVFVIDKKTKKEDFEKFLLDRQKTHKKGFDAKKYCGVIKLKESPMTIQNRLRDEWK